MSNTVATDNRVNSLFRPFSGGGLDLSNRIVMAPMTRCFSPGGVPGENVAAYYRRRAEGGVGLIITEGTWVPHAAASNDAMVPRFYGEDALAGWKKVVDAVHQAGSKIVPQLWHVGLVKKFDVSEIKQGKDEYGLGVSPSGYYDADEKVADPMSLAEIARLAPAYAEAAAAAQKLGFDGVEIHGAHGYLIDQFLWPVTNRREDAYGGSLENRARLATEIVSAIRARVGPAFPIIFRFSQWKQQDYAARLFTSPVELEKFLQLLVDAGVSLFHCSQRRFQETEFPDSPLNLAGWTRKLSGVPTISVGSVGLDGDFMTGLMTGKGSGVAGLNALTQMMERGDFDLIAVGRALITNPSWANIVKSGHMGELGAYSVSELDRLY